MAVLLSQSQTFRAVGDLKSQGKNVLLSRVAAIHQSRLFFPKIHSRAK